MQSTTRWCLDEALMSSCTCAIRLPSRRSGRAVLAHIAASHIRYELRGLLNNGKRQCIQRFFDSGILSPHHLSANFEALEPSKIRIEFYQKT